MRLLSFAALVLALFGGDLGKGQAAELDVSRGNRGVANITRQAVYRPDCRVGWWQSLHPNGVHFKPTWGTRCVRQAVLID